MRLSSVVVQRDHLEQISNMLTISLHLYRSSLLFYLDEPKIALYNEHIVANC